MQTVTWKKTGSLRGSIVVPIDDLIQTISVHLTIHGSPSDWVTIRHGAAGAGAVSLEDLRDDLLALADPDDRVIQAHFRIENLPDAAQTVKLRFDGKPDDPSFEETFKVNVPAGGSKVTGFRVKLEA